MDKKLINIAIIMFIILLCGVSATTSLAIDLPWEKEKKEETPQGLPPPPKIPDDISKPPSGTPAPPTPTTTLPKPPIPTTTPPPTPQGPIQVNVLGLVLAGDWISNNRPARIMQSGDALTFINEHGQRSSGHFVRRNVVVAVDWEGGLQGHTGANINGAFFGPTEAREVFGAGVNEIRWANGTIWKLAK